MKYLSDSLAAVLDIRVDYPETFYRTFKLSADDLIVASDNESVTAEVGLGTVTDWTYYDAEFKIWISGQDKVLKEFTLDNGLMVAVSDELQIDQDLGISEGFYRYHLMISTPLGRDIVVAKGNFIYTKE